MLLTLLLSPVLHFQDLRQPTTMEVVGYQRVQHALPDGRPDLDAPDNFYIQTRTQWFLQSDTDSLPLDQNGKYHLQLPKFEATIYERYEEKGKSSGKLGDKFIEVLPQEKKGQFREVGKITSGGMENTGERCQRVLYWRVRSITTKVETHTIGRRRATRTLTSANWSFSSAGWPTGKTYIPDTDPKVIFESGKHVQVDTPIYGYAPVVSLPGDKDF